MNERLDRIARDAGCSQIDSEAFAQYLDEHDGLKAFRDRFHCPTKATVSREKRGASDEQRAVYLAGNSLGLQPKDTEKLLLEELQAWKQSAVLGHFEHPFDRPWLTIEDCVVPILADVVGANTSEVACMGSLTANLHLLMTNFYRPTKDRFKILFEAKAFPSDAYAFASQAAMHGHGDDALLTMEPLAGETTIMTDDILKIIEEQGDHIAVICFGAVQYYSGEFFDMEAITKAGHAKGCLVAFDLAHAVGNVPLQLHDWGVDFACWCSYKYLNAGPGGIAGIFVHERWANKQRLSGWWGHDLETRFQMPFKYSPAPGTAGFQLSNPSVLDVISLYASLQLFKESSQVPLSWSESTHGVTSARREKSELLTGYLEALLKKSAHYAPYAQFNEQRQQRARFTIITPADPARRGAQLSLLFDPVEAMDVVFEDLRSQGVLGDERRPGVIRLAPVPLYNSFSDCLAAAKALDSALERYCSQ